MSDHRGRVWVCEVVNYRRHNGERAAGDRILILEDTNHDGVMDIKKPCTSKARGRFGHGYLCARQSRDRFGLTERVDLYRRQRRRQTRSKRAVLFQDRRCAA